MTKNNRVLWVVEIDFADERGWKIHEVNNFYTAKKWGLKAIREMESLYICSYKFRLIKYVPEVVK